MNYKKKIEKLENELVEKNKIENRYFISLVIIGGFSIVCNIVLLFI